MMREEEAIKIIRKYECNKEHYEACEMAIKALEQTEPEKCGDCVSRQAVLDLAERGRLVSNGNYKSVCDAINGLPSIEPERIVGHWIYGTDDETGKAGFYAWTCSECYEKYPWQPKFCPNCGAKMEVEN